MRKFLKVILGVLVFNLTLASQLDKKIDKIEEMPQIPKNLSIPDWKDKAIKYDEFVYDFNSKGKYLPLIWMDKTHNTYGLKTFVGDFRNKDGSQEGINLLGSILGATFVGVDKSNQDGKNYVKMAQRFYNKKEGVFNNVIDREIGETFWYELFPNILYWQIAYYYPNVEGNEEILKSTAEKWYIVAEKLGRDEKNFNYTSFDFEKNKGKTKNWIEPDSAVGIALIEYMAYKRFGDKKYLEAAKWAMDYIDSREDNPYYEVLGSYAPYLASRMNSEVGTNYDVDKMVNWIFNGDSVARDSWGVATGKWGEYEVNGLMGSLNDGGGYMFTMNTFANMSALIPLVNYELSYANSIGKFVLNVANNSKLFYKDGIEKKHQWEDMFEEDKDSVIPYEGLRYEEFGMVPFATGDPIKHKWGETNYSLYSGSYVGFLGGVIEKTEIPEIIKVDLKKGDYYSKLQNSQYLLYNPLKSEKKIKYKPKKDGVDLYENISQKYLGKNISGEIEIIIPAESSIVVSEIEKNQNVTTLSKMNMLDKAVLTNSRIGVVNILDLKNKKRVSGEIAITVEQFGKNQKLEFFIGEEQVKLEEKDGKYILKTQESKNGFHNFKVILKDKDGKILDQSERKLLFFNKR